MKVPNICAVHSDLVIMGFGDFLCETCSCYKFPCPATHIISKLQFNLMQFA